MKRSADNVLILDFSSVIIANLHAQIGLHNMREVEEDLLRHMILNTVRALRVKFKKEELIIACDMGSWRKQAYPYYKANRAKAKEKSDLNWTAIFEIFTKMRNDLRDYFPYRVIEVQGAEADDVIAALVFEYGDNEGLAMNIGTQEDIIIVSPDKDFAQLHRFPNVKQFDPIKKKWIEHVDADAYLVDHVIKGDSGDGVPNIMSDDDTFMIPGKRQKPMTAKRLEEFRASIPDEFKKNFDRNTLVIDLRNTPQSLRTEIIEVYKQQAGKDRSQIFNYMMKNKLRNLLEAIQEF